MVDPLSMASLESKSLTLSCSCTTWLDSTKVANNSANTAKETNTKCFIFFLEPHISQLTNTVQVGHLRESRYFAQSENRLLSSQIALQSLGRYFVKRDNWRKRLLYPSYLSLAPMPQVHTLTLNLYSTRYYTRIYPYCLCVTQRVMGTLWIDWGHASILIPRGTSYCLFMFFLR